MTPTSTPRPQISPSEGDRIQTHARSILEGEGQDEHDPALVEAVARAIDPSVWALSDLSERLLDDWHKADRAKSLRQAEAALSTIRKHQAGE